MIHQNPAHHAREHRKKVRAVLLDGVAVVDQAKVGLVHEAARLQGVLASFAAYFGAAATTPVTYVESDWQHQELTGGAYGTSFDLGGLSRWGHDQRVPVGPIRFSSSDIAAEGFQHVDGAIRVGHDVAAEILAERDAQPEHAEHADTGAAVS